MAYRTIKQRAHEEAKRATRPTCKCGTHIKPKDLCYYINEYGERVPICWLCMHTIRKALDVEDFAWLMGEG